MNIKHLLASVALLASVSAAAECAPKYIFYYIGDGMGMGPVNAAQTYLRQTKAPEAYGSQQLLTMHTFPVVSWCQTYSYSSPVTDSAAAGTALATGHKTNNGMLGMGPDTTAVTSIAAQLFEKGYGVGIVTSVAPDDATPGAFYAHVPTRKDLYDIGCQMAECGYQFVAGAGLRGLEKDGQPTDLPEKFAQNNVQIVYGPDQIADISSDRVLLLNPEGSHNWNVGYTIDSIAGVLTLPQITQTCLAQLERTSPDRFFMMVEGGNIDHALHANDGGAAVKEILNFNEALRYAVDFYNQHPSETLIIVTADHDTGGMAVAHNAKNIKYIDCQKVSKEEFSDYCKALLRSRRVYTWDDMREYLSENLGLFTVIPVSSENEQQLKEMFDQTFEMRNSADQQTLYANFNAFAVEVFSLFNKAAGFAFTTTSHTGNPVPVYAIGCGADMFKGLNNNIEIPQKLRQLTGVTQ